MTVAAIGPTPPVQGTEPLSPSQTKLDHKVREAAREFEAMLVRQMLTAAGMGGKDKDSPYAGMQIDALAKAVTAGRGLGLAQQIADSLAREAHIPRGNPTGK
jgi:Rod binding domain-containing protein